MNPGQYQAAHEGQYQDLEPAYPRPGDYEVNEVKVDFDNRDEHKIYNVQAKAGDFIIGEVGKIDVNNGQTVEVSTGFSLEFSNFNIAVTYTLIFTILQLIVIILLDFFLVESSLDLRFGCLSAIEPGLNACFQ